MAPIWPSSAREGHNVAGIVRRSSTTPYERIAHLVDRVTLVSADLLDQHSLVAAMAECSPIDLQFSRAELRQTSWESARTDREFTPRWA